MQAVEHAVGPLLVTSKEVHEASAGLPGTSTMSMLCRQQKVV